MSAKLPNKLLLIKNYYLIEILCYKLIVGAVCFKNKLYMSRYESFNYIILFYRTMTMTRDYNKQISI